jgi:predicted SAM-dependent methyltransferase
MKLNLGCGFNKLKEYTNVDKDKICNPDLIFDCEKHWPLDDSVVEELVLFHAMEHMGETFEQFVFLLKEMYRVSNDGCLWKITVPHYNSDVFHIDPTHVRKIHPMTMRMFDQEDNVKDIKNGGHYTKLGLMYNIDIEVIKEIFYLSEPWNTDSATLNSEKINFAGRHYNNVGSDIYIECKVHKPQRHNNFKYTN